MKGIQKKWWHNAVVYQIYPRSFKDSNGDGIGDLQGIIENLDYLSEILGVDAIWLNPIYKSPQKDFGYDISDYYDIDPIFGDLEIFDVFIDEAHRRGIKVFMDFVPNHTSSEHPWFLESRSSRNNPKRDWYIWHDPKPHGSIPNNWLSVFGGPAWTYHPQTRQYYLHSFLPDQPDLNWRNQDVRNEMVKILNFWLKRGVDGFRTDAIYHLIKDKQFRDDPPNPNYAPGKDEPYNSLLHIYSSGGGEMFDIINTTMCATLTASEKDAFMISEAYLGISEMAQLYQSCEDKNHAPFNFNLLSASWNAAVYKRIIDDFESSMSENDVPNYVLGNHDRSRVASHLGEKRARLAALIQLTLRGMAFIYYGDELGMEDGKIPSDNAQDPWGKNMPDFKVGRDPERTSMQWSPETYAGFSTVKPWLPVSLEYKEHNVESELKNKLSILNLYRSLIAFRKTSNALRFGKYVKLSLSGNGSVFGFLREHEKEKIFVVVNFSDTTQQVMLTAKEKEAYLTDRVRGTVVCNTYCDSFGKEITIGDFALRPDEGCVITLHK